MPTNSGNHGAQWQNDEGIFVIFFFFTLGGKKSFDQKEDFFFLKKKDIFTLKVCPFSVRISIWWQGGNATLNSMFELIYFVIFIFIIIFLLSLLWSSPEIECCKSELKDRMFPVRSKSQVQSITECFCLFWNVKRIIWTSWKSRG